MGYFNNDNFKKIRKIFYIVAIISMLLSIKNKVFADSSFEFTSLQNVSYNIPNFDSLINDNPNYSIIIIWKRANGNIYISFTNTAAYSGFDTPYLSVVAQPSSYTGYNLQFYNYGQNYYLSNDNWVLDNPFTVGQMSLNFYDLIATNIDLKNATGDNTIFNANIINFNNPFFDNVTEIENGNPDGVLISPGQLLNTDNLYFHLLEINSGISNSDNSLYYYNDKTFLLNKDSDYYRTWLDPNIEGFYYYIPRYKLGLSTNTSYLYVLNNSNEQIQNSYGLYEQDIPNGIYDVLQSDTAGVITSTEEQSERMKNIELSITSTDNSINNINNSVNNINNTLNDTTISEDTQTDIDTNLQFNNQNEGLNNLNGGFFSRLTTMLSNLLGYNLAEDTSVSIPLPNSNQSITLHSIDIYNNVTGAIRLIINAFWLYIFTFYMWKFINKIYIAVSTGNILDTFSSSGEAITNDML